MCQFIIDLGVSVSDIFVGISTAPYKIKREALIHRKNQPKDAFYHVFCTSYLEGEKISCKNKILSIGKASGK